MPTPFEKLVRDRIPEIIQASGRTCEITVLEGDAFDKALRAKLAEESREVEAATTQAELLLELADVLEVLEALTALHQIEWEAVRAKQAERRLERGGFERRIWLQATEDT